MSEADSQATVAYSYSISDISNNELSQACDVLLQQTDGSADRHFLDFSDISDTELSAASQAFEDSCVTVKQSTANLDNVPNGKFSDISDCELQSALHTYKNDDYSFVSCVPRNNGRVFREPVSTDVMEQLKSSRFPKNTVDKSTWAVTLFGEWRAQRNSRCLRDPNAGLVYLNKPFSQMTDDDLNYSMPLFISEVLKSDGTEYPPDTLQ